MILAYTDDDERLAGEWADKLLGSRGANFVEFNADKRSLTTLGLLAEILTSRTLGVEWRHPGRGPDGGVDLNLGGLSVQVKYNQYHWGDFYCRPDQPLRSAMGVLVVPTNPATCSLRIAGWLSADDYELHAVEKSYGHNTVRAVAQEHLRSIDLLVGLV